VQWSESISNMVSAVIRRYIDHMKFATFMAITFIAFIHVLLVPFLYIIYGHMFCMLLFNFVNVVLLLFYLYILIVMYVPVRVFRYIVLFCVLFVCKCVMYYCHKVSSRLQLTNNIISYIIPYRTKRDVTGNASVKQCGYSSHTVSRYLQVVVA
jgi:hypothetical protein